MSAHRAFDQAQAQAEQVEQRIELAAAEHRARRGPPVEQLAFEMDVERVSPASDEIAARSNIGQRSKAERAAWARYRARVLPELWERQGGAARCAGTPST